MSLAIRPQRRVNACAFTLALLAVTWLRRVARRILQPRCSGHGDHDSDCHGVQFPARSGRRCDHALAAWGDRLTPGMKAIAVSRDLILGLDYNAEVQTRACPGPAGEGQDALALEKKIDIYMGEDIQAARQGRRKVTITFLHLRRALA